MAWVTALVKAILEWATAEIKKDTKAGDADSTPQSLKDRWRRKIEEQEKKWTDEQNEYIKEYRARKTYAPGYEYLSDFNNPLNGAEYDKAIKEARITAKGGNAGYLNLARLYIYKKYLDPNPNDGLLDIRQERNEPVATPTPRPTLSEALGEPELFPEFK